jgi:hypothetical protein
VVQNDDENTSVSSLHTTTVEVSPASGTRASITTHNNAQKSLLEENPHPTQPVVTGLIKNAHIALVFPAVMDGQEVQFDVSTNVLCAA